MRAAITLALALAASATAAERRITDADVRAFVARQEELWNAGDVAGYFATFTPDARITDQARTGDGKVVPYGTSTLPQARTQARRFFAENRVAETSEVLAIQIAPDGRSASVTLRETSRITAKGRARTVCGESAQTLVLQAGRIVSKGQTDTVLRCPH